MKSFSPGYLEKQPIPHSLLQTVRLLGEFRGKEALFERQTPQSLETLRTAAVIQSTESSNRIEGVVAPLARIQSLVAEKTRPRNRSEQEIAGYRDVLNTIHTSWEYMRLTPNLVLQLHRDLFRYSPSPGGHWKNSDNEIHEIHPGGERVVRFNPVAAHQTPDAMRELHQQWSERWQAEELEKLILIPAYVLDFLCIHPFLDGNGRMARLLSLLLLYQAGYRVGRYVSLERQIEQARDGYYDSLRASSSRWHEGRHALLPWTEYFLGVLLAAYREFESRVGVVTSARGAKTEMVREAVRNLPSGFRMVDLERACPNVTREMIRVVLNRLKKEGEISCEGAGRGARWRKRGNES